jgi:hypothetical protein
VIVAHHGSEPSAAPPFGLHAIGEVIEQSLPDQIVFPGDMQPYDVGLALVVGT